jgi:4'-phosphopantetheinyl transferase
VRRVELLVQSASAVPSASDWLGEAERAREDALQSAQRRRDWRTGRWTAKHALLRYLGLAPTPARMRSVEIQADPGGAPVAWAAGAPLPCCLSISHRADAANAAVGRSDLALGCDLERDDPRSDAFVAHFLAESEQRDLAALPASARACAATLLWSAKESALKALGAGLRADAREVVIRAASLGAAGRAWEPLRVESALAAARLEGWWCRRGGWLLTVVADGTIAAPIFRVAPSLALAQPAAVL